MLRDYIPMAKITVMADCNLYAFSIWERHRYGRNPATAPANILVSNITTYITAYRNIQGKNDYNKEPVIKMPSHYNKNNKWNRPDQIYVIHGQVG